MERHDRAAIEQRTDTLLHDTRVVEDLERQQAANEGLRAQLVTLRDEMRRLQGDYEVSVRLMEEEVERRHAKEQRLGEAEEAVRNLDLRLAALMRGQESHGKAGGLSEAQRKAIAAALEGRSPTPEQCLHIVECLYGARVEILDTARASARDAAPFKHGDKLLHLLVTLATAYWGSMVDGGGDAVARQVFGDKVFAARESRTATSNERARRERTFEFRGKTLLMWRHLRIGAKDAIEESVRVYFDWIADDRKIVIGHCGEHLYLPSFGM